MSLAFTQYSCTENIIWMPSISTINDIIWGSDVAIICVFVDLCAVLFLFYCSDHVTVIQLHIFCDLTSNLLQFCDSRLSFSVLRKMQFHFLVASLFSALVEHYMPVVVGVDVNWGGGGFGKRVVGCTGVKRVIHGTGLKQHTGGRSAVSFKQYRRRRCFGSGVIKCLLIH